MTLKLVMSSCLVIGLLCALMNFLLFGGKYPNQAPSTAPIEPYLGYRGDPIKIYPDGGVTFPSTFGTPATIVTDTVDGKKVVTVTFELDPPTTLPKLENPFKPDYVYLDLFGNPTSRPTTQPTK